MSNRLNAAGAIDPVDWFTTEVLRNPERADDLKDSLRRQIGLAASEWSRAEEPDPADADDLWNNVPV
jgi:hypothetical protein